MSATDSHTVMKFVHVQFDENWQTGNIGEWGKEYRAIKDGAYITLLAEDKNTYWYKLNNGAVVWVSANHNIIFVPGWVVEPPK